MTDLGLTIRTFFVSSCVVLAACGGDDGGDTAPADLGPPTDAAMVDGAPSDGGPNAPPTAMALDVRTYLGVAVEGELEASDPDGDELTFAVATEPEDGTVDLDPSTGAFTYTPDEDFVGDDAFIFEASDGALSSEPALVSVTVHPLTDGTLDPTFGTDGVVLDDVFLSDIASMEDGRMATVGLDFTSGAFVGMRDADGSLDTSFGTDGRTDIDALFENADLEAVVPGPSSDVFVAGGDGNDDALVGRLTSEGAVDDTFGTDGFVRLDVAGDFDHLWDLWVGDEGDVLAVGFAEAGADGRDIAVLRLTADGTPDPDFGTDGVVQLDFAGGFDSGSDVLVDDEGRIVVAGRVAEGSDDHAVLVRLGADGTLDTTFGDNGWAILDGPAVAAGRAVHLDEEGDLWLAAAYFSGDDGSMVLAAFDGDGELRTDFASDGQAVVDFPSDGASVSDMIRQPDGAFLLVGSAGAFGGSPYVATAVRLRPDGSLDPTFDGDGIWSEDLVPTDLESTLGAVLFQPDGTVVVMGDQRDVSSGISFTGSFLARLAR